MSVYRKTITLKNKDVNLYRRLRTSRLMEILQEACIAHTEELGAGRVKTLDKGILWVVIQQHLNILKMPCYDDTITVETWPGKTMHVLFPRYFRILDKKGKPMIIGSSLWTLIHAETRKMIFADRYGIEVPEEITGNEVELPRPIRREETTEHSLFTVPFSYCDLNGHMNNTRYFDLAEDNMKAPQEGKELVSVTSEFASEAPFQKTMTVSWTHHDKEWYVTGEADKLCFRMLFQYKD